MKNKFLFLLTMMGGLCMSACGGNPGPDVPPDDPKPVEIDATVDAVINAIAQIGDVTGEDGPLIEGISIAFSALTIEEKKQVTNYQTLFDAQKEYAMRDGLVVGEFDENNIVRRLGCLSDIHNSDNIPLSIEILKSLGMDTLVIAGDITDGVRYYNTGEKEIKSVKSNLEIELPDDMPVVMTLGNHDTSNGSNCALFYDVMGERYFGGEYLVSSKEDVRTKGVAHMKIGDYHFITLECDYTTVSGEGLTDDSCDFLERTMKEITESDDYNGEFIFVVTHLIPSGTLYHSSNSTKINQILKFYPQAVVIAGHTHYTIHDEMEIDQNRFTTFNPGGTQYVISGTDFLNANTYGLYQGGEGYTSYNLPEGALVELDDKGNMRIRRFDMRREDLEIRTPWVISAPKVNNSHLCSYPRDRAYEPYNHKPYFEDPTNVNATCTYTINKSKYDVTITFDAAKDEDFIYWYNIVIDSTLGTNLLAGKWVTEYFLYADSSKIPSRFVMKLTGLSGIPAKIKISPVDTYRIAGDTITVELNPQKV